MPSNICFELESGQKKTCNVFSFRPGWALNKLFNQATWLEAVYFRCVKYKENGTIFIQCKQRCE